MDKQMIQDAVNEKLTIKELSEKFNCSKTNIRYWLKKYDIKIQSKFSHKSKNGDCVNCGKMLTGLQRKYCSNICKCNHNNRNVNDGKGYQTYQNQKKRGHDRKREFVELKGGGCQLCGYNKSLRALTFHHRDPSDKKTNLDIRGLSNRTYSACLKEVEKCDLLCFNCHMELHENEQW
jgi:hypothetical protein